MKAKWIDTAGSILPFAFLIYILIAGCLLALSAVVPFNGYPIDGPFQIFDPLRRIAAGQIPGVDFQFYHGILIPFIHYPLFALLGKTIFASEISRQIVSIFAFVASLYLLFFAYTRKLQAAATLSSLAFVLVYAVGASQLVFPSGSLTGLRSTMPLIFFAFLLADFPAIRAAAALGIVGALAIATSTENGLAVTLAFTISALIFALRHGQLARYWRLAGVFLASLAAGLVIILGSLSHFRGILSILRYNFVDVPKDQYWLFGSAPANAPASLADLFIDPWFWVPLAVTFIFFLAALLATLLLPAKSLAQLPTAGLAMALYALATFTPYLSRYNAEYAQPAIRICSIYLVLILAQFTPIKPALHIVTAVLIIWFATLRPNVLDIASLISRLPAHSKVIVWAATVHLAKDLSVVPGHEGYVTMGPLIYRDFNSQSFVLGFSAYSGTYAPVTHPAQQLSAAPNNSLEGQAFANNNSDTHYMNSEQIRKLGPVPARPLGSEFRTARWDQVVDGILLFRTEHPPTLVQP